jgi:phage repressor protein C with HTH and peptisase S24 domain
MAKTKVAPDPNVGKNIAALMDSVPELGSQSLLAAKAGLAQSTIGRILRGEVDPTAGNLRKIANAFGVWAETLYWSHDRFKAVLANDGLRQLQAALPSSREIDLDNNPDYPAVRRATVKAGAGITGFAIDYEHSGAGDGAPIVFRRDWYERHGYRPDRMIAMRVHGASMEPTLYDGDLIVVNMDSTTPKDGVAFLVLYEGEPVVKRLMRDAGAWWLASDNPDQRRYPRKLCDDATRIVGEVVYRQSERV